MSDVFDRASEREEADRAAALACQARRAGLSGKTVADSAAECRLCDEAIPPARRQALPGVQLCCECQQELEMAATRFGRGRY